MTIHWSLLVPGALLLIFPADRLLTRTVQLRGFERFQSLENSPRFRPWWWVPALWLDPLRGLGGTLLLRHAFAIVSPEWTLAPKPAYAIMMALLAVAVPCQMFTRREEDVMLAPIGFVAGMVVALTAWPVAAIGLAVAVTAVFAFRQFHAFFSVGLVAVAGLGALLQADAMWLVPAAGVLALPLAIAVGTGNALEIPTRNASGPARPAHPRREG